MKKDQVLRAQQYNCDKCGVPVGKECLSKKGKPMAFYVHPRRGPTHPLTNTARYQIAKWLSRYADIFQETE